MARHSVVTAWLPRSADTKVNVVTRSPGRKKLSYLVHGAKTVIEATYLHEIAPWWQVQPDLQYVIRPGAGCPTRPSP